MSYLSTFSQKSLAFHPAGSLLSAHQCKLLISPHRHSALFADFILSFYHLFFWTPLPSGHPQPVSLVSLSRKEGDSDSFLTRTRWPLGRNMFARFVTGKQVHLKVPCGRNSSPCWPQFSALVRTLYTHHQPRQKV